MDYCQARYILWHTAGWYNKIYIENLKTGLNSLSAKVNQPYPDASSGETSFINLVNGVSANSPNSLYEFNISSPSINSNNYSIVVSVDKDVTVSYLKLDFILYNLRTSLFASDGGFTTSGITAGSPIYIQAHHNFAPIKYLMIGWDSIKLNNRSLMLDFDMDKDMIISITTPNTISSVRTVYLTVGTRMSDVCSKCSSFFVIG